MCSRKFLTLPINHLTCKGLKVAKISGHIWSTATQRVDNFKNSTSNQTDENVYNENIHYGKRTNMGAD